MAAELDSAAHEASVVRHWPPGTGSSTSGRPDAATLTEEGAPASDFFVSYVPAAGALGARPERA